MKSGRIKSFFNSFRAGWYELTGKPDEQVHENRGFNVVSLYMILLLGVLIPVDFYLGLWETMIGLVVTEGLLITMFCLSRYRGLHRAGLMVYAIYSYFLIIFVYFFNGGSEGPILYFLLLTYLLLIAFTPQSLHWIWTMLHLVLPVGLLAVEFTFPTAVTTVYDSSNARFIDLVTSLPIVIICIFAATSYLRKGFERERLAAEVRAKQIADQHAQIKLQNELLTTANREKIELISIMGHDLKNPLNAMTGTLEILNQEDLPADVRKKLKEDLLAAAHNTSALLNNVLAWVSGQIKGIHPLLTWVEPYLVIERVLSVQGYIAKKKKIKIQWHAEKGLKVISDAEMLEVIIRNLVSNALKFTPKRGTIQLSVTEDTEKGQCIVAVHDDGVGMTNEDVKRIFNGRIQSTYGTESEKGIGLGLLLCRELAIRLNGEIRVESELGKGSTFFLALPQHGASVHKHSPMSGVSVQSVFLSDSIS